MIKLFALAITLLIATSAQARVFNLGGESFAGYFSVGGGSSIGTSAVDNESGPGISFSKKSEYAYSGEFGVLYTASRLGFRVGIEILKPQLAEGNASDGSGDLYSYSSEVMAYAPKLGLEINLDQTSQSRSFISIAGSFVDVTMKNDYVLTAAGQTAYTGVYSHATESKGSATSLSASLGYEGVFTDTTTLVFEMGYRQLNVNNFKYSKSVTTFSGAKNSGDAVVDSDGKARALNMGGFFLALGFRFYL